MEQEVRCPKCNGVGQVQALEDDPFSLVNCRLCHGDGVLFLDTLGQRMAVAEYEHAKEYGANNGKNH